MINLVATAVVTLCVGFITLILVTSKYRRTVSKMLFFVTSHDNSDYVAVITLVVLISLESYYVTRAQLSILRFRFFLLFISLFDVKSSD